LSVEIFSSVLLLASEIQLLRVVRTTVAGVGIRPKGYAAKKNSGIKIIRINERKGRSEMVNALRSLVPCILALSITSLQAQADNYHHGENPMGSPESNGQLVAKT
jgi:hypothetical protein